MPLVYNAFAIIIEDEAHAIVAAFLRGIRFEKLATITVDGKQSLRIERGNNDYAIFKKDIIIRKVIDALAKASVLVHNYFGAWIGASPFNNSGACCDTTECAKLRKQPYVFAVTDRRRRRYFGEQVAKEIGFPLNRWPRTF